MIKYIPNILTVIRLLLIPLIIVFVFTENYFYAFLTFTFSGITDILDGFIARKYNVISNFGKLIDPLADKLTQISVIASLTALSIIPVWVLILICLKELVMIVGAAFLYGKSVVVFSQWYGKLATILFYLAITSSLIMSQLETKFLSIYIYLYILASISTVFSLIMYIKNLYQNGTLDRKDLRKEVRFENVNKHKKVS